MSIGDVFSNIVVMLDMMGLLTIIQAVVIAIAGIALFKAIRS